MANTIIRTNILSLNAHRNLGKVGNQQTRASQRLSSGFRINTAADDAAGLGISEKMRAQIRSLDRASLNAQDGMSLIQTAEGAMATINEMLIRLRELLVQAANDTNVHDPAALNQSDRIAIQDEIDQIMLEINSVAFRTEFNTRTLLDGSLSLDGVIRGGDWHTIDEVRINAPARITTLDQFLRMTDREPFVGSFADLLNRIGANLEGKTADQWIAVHASANFSGLEQALNAAMVGRWNQLEIKSGLSFRNANDLLNSFVQGLHNPNALRPGNMVGTAQQSFSGWADFLANANPNLGAASFARAVSQTGGEQLYQALIRTGFQGLDGNSTFSDVRNIFYRMGGASAPGWGLGGLRDDLFDALSYVGPGRTRSWLENRVLGASGFSFSAATAAVDTFSIEAASVEPAIVTPLSTPPNATPDRTININALTGTIPPGTHDGWHFLNGILHITGDGDFQINGTGVATTNRIEVAAGATVNIGLNNVNVNTGAGAALYMQGATVELWLVGNNTMITTHINSAGIQTTGGTLTIEGVGELTSIGGPPQHHPDGAVTGGGAGIGGGVDADGGNITIRNGIITASTTGIAGGFSNAAGIGGGGGIGASLGSGTNHSGNITIYGGTIISTGGSGAGIGNGTDGFGGNITINGGNIVASSGFGSGAGIGGGIRGYVNNITINNGDIEATSMFGAGIGSGPTQDNGGTITINGGSVTAISTFSGAGIGGGAQGAGGTIIITGGFVEAISTGVGGAGIGGGVTGGGGGGAGNITISGGEVRASSSNGPSVGGLGGVNLIISGGLLDIPNGQWIGNEVVPAGINGRTTYTNGNLPPTIAQILSGVVDANGNPLRQVQVPINQWNYIPGDRFIRTVIIYGITFAVDAIIDRNGELFIWIPESIVEPPGPDPSDPDDLWEIFVNRYLTADSEITQREIWLANPEERERGLPLWFQIGANSGQGILVGINGMTTRDLGYPHDLINMIDVENPSGIPISGQIDLIDNALTHVNRERSFLGAVQNRLEFAKLGLDISSENLSAANSRIRDADMAREMMRLTQANVLQQAAISMLAQANQAPNDVLQLLQ